MRRAWASVRSAIDRDRFREVDDFLRIQEREAMWWRDSALQYFQTFSRRPLPAGVEAPPHPLEFYGTLRCRQNRLEPRCPAVY